MKRLLVLLALLPLATQAEITGPTSTATGSIALSWDSPEASLIEVSSTGTPLASWWPSPANIVKTSSGTYYFEEQWCGDIPFLGYYCVTIDSHQVTVNIGGGGGGGGTGSSYPQSLLEQAGYDYQIRSGDFDGNGRVDLYVERLTAGPADGSMPSYVVWNNSNGTISTTALSSWYASVAQNAPINTTLNLMQTDISADGYADHVIERINEVMGAGFEQELAVYAPGTEPDKTRPQGTAQITQAFRSFFLDLARWMNDENYFANNIQTAYVPVLAVGFSCQYGSWSQWSYGYSGGGFCSVYVYVIGYVPVQYGVNFSALAAASYLDQIPPGGPVSVNDMWQISQIARGVIGTHLFGFDANGNWRPTNHNGPTDADRRFTATFDWLGFALVHGAKRICVLPYA